MTNDSFAVTDISSASEWEKFGFANTVQLSQLVKFRNEPNELQDAQYLSLIMGQGVIKYEDKGNVGNKKPEDLTRCKKVHAGDMVVNSMNFKIGSFGISPYDGVVSTVYHVMSPVEHLLNTAYLNYWFGVGEFRSQAQNMGNGILEHRRAIKEDRFGAIRIPLPDLDTQRRIADYLDKETAQIDTLVAELDGYVELLEKRRKVVITEAVTKRVPGAEVMAAFPMVPVGLVASVLQSNVDKKSKDGEDSVRLLNYTDVYYNDKIDLSHDFMVATASTEQIERLKLHVGDVVITKDSETADDIGIPALVSETADDFVCAYHLSILRPDTSKVTGDYLFWCMKSKPTANYWESRANGVTRVSIPSTTVTSLKFPLPNLDTQRRIADYLDKETARIDTLIKECRELKEILLKRRQVLITDVVTGKVEV